VFYFEKGRKKEGGEGLGREEQRILYKTAASQCLGKVKNIPKKTFLMWLQNACENAAVFLC